MIADLLDCIVEDLVHQTDYNNYVCVIIIQYYWYNCRLKKIQQKKQRDRDKAEEEKKKRDLLNSGEEGKE